MSSMLEYGNWNGMQKGNLSKESRYGFVCRVGWDGMMMIEKYGGWVRRGRPAFV